LRGFALGRKVIAPQAPGSAQVLSVASFRFSGFGAIRARRTAPTTA
jgi:hypothetical protein